MVYLLYNITMARTAHPVTNLILSVLQRTRYSCVTSGSSNISTSAAADHAMSSGAVANMEKENTPSLEQTWAGFLAHRQGSAHGSVFCRVFSGEVLQRSQMDDNRRCEYSPISSDGGSPSNECSGCVKQAYLNRSSSLWQAGRGCQVKSSYVVSE